MATVDESSPFRCSICFNSKEGRQPRALSCVHSFCQECLTEWHETRHRNGHCARTRVECPTCRTQTALPSGNISSLPIDINVQKFADFINNETTPIVCQVCKKKKGNSLCMMCSVILCENCGEKHKQSPLFSTHVLSRNICQIHGAALQGVCTTCMCGVCLHCVNEDLHKDHSLDEMSPWIQIIKGNVEQYTRELQELLRIGNIEVPSNRRYLEQFQCIEEIKRLLDSIKQEVERLEKEITEHEQLCTANIDAVFKEYKVHSERASAAILHGTQLLEEDEVGILDKLNSTEVPNKEMCRLVRNSLSSIPDFSSVSSRICRLDNAENALKALRKCKLVCGIPDVTTIPFIPAPPVEILKIKCGDGCDIEDPWRLCGTPAGDVIVCNHNGGPVYKVHTDGTKTQLHDDGIAACVHDGDVHVISTDGDEMIQLKQDGSTVNHKLKPPVTEPTGLALCDDNVFVLYNDSSLTKRAHLTSDCSDIFRIEDYNDLRHILRINHQGMTKLVLTDWDTHHVIICDEAGAGLTRFGGCGSQDGEFKYPGGISRMSNGNLLVADLNNHKIVEYDMDGMFVRNLLTGTMGLRHPADIVYRHPYVWIVENADGQPYYLKLFKFEV